MLTPESLVKAEGLNKSFGTVQAVSDVSFTVTPGEMLALIGPNGAGKSTVLKTLFGILVPRSGEVRFEGARINGKTDLRKYGFMAWLLRMNRVRGSTTAR